MKSRNRFSIFGIVFLLLMLCGTGLYRHLVYNKIADLGGMENVLPDQSALPDSETAHSFTYSLDSNKSTGYEWKAMIVDGSSVSVNEYGYYQENPNQEMMDGVGGTQHFEIFAVHSGVSVLHFVYSRNAYDIADERYLIATVNEEMRMTLRPVDESTVLECDVLEVNETERSLLLFTDSMEDVFAFVTPDIALPHAGERIAVFTDGVVTASLPPVVNVLWWGKI